MSGVSHGPRRRARVGRWLLIAALTPMMRVVYWIDQRMVPRAVPVPPQPPVSEEELQRIATSWFDGYELLGQARPDDPTSPGILYALSIDELARGDPERLWPILGALIAEAPSDAALMVVAAGPLENLMDWHGLRFLDRAALLASTDERWHRALRGVWGWERFPRAVRERLFPILTPEFRAKDDAA